MKITLKCVRSVASLFSLDWVLPMGFLFRQSFHILFLCFFRFLQMELNALSTIVNYFHIFVFSGITIGNLVFSSSFSQVLENAILNILFFFLSNGILQSVSWIFSKLPDRYSSTIQSYIIHTSLIDTISSHHVDPDVQQESTREKIFFTAKDITLLFC